jgi:hypothetical protein
MEPGGDGIEKVNWERFYSLHDISANFVIWNK